MMTQPRSDSGWSIYGLDYRIIATYLKEKESNFIYGRFKTEQAGLEAEL